MLRQSCFQFWFAVSHRNAGSGFQPDSILATSPRRSLVLSSRYHGISTSIFSWGIFEHGNLFLVEIFRQMAMMFIRFVGLSAPPSVLGRQAT